MATTIKPPSPIAVPPGTPSVFLAGSIEMGQAEDWQAAFERALADLPAVILNPRRDEWDASWVQSIANPPFRAQVEWELAAQEQATVIAMYFAPATKAPITLLELGLFARTGKVIACCPDGYWRKGNVEVVCARYGVALVSSLDDLVAWVRKRLRLQPPVPVPERQGMLEFLNSLPPNRKTLEEWEQFERDFQEERNSWDR